MESNVEKQEEEEQEVEENECGECDEVRKTVQKVPEESPEGMAPSMVVISAKKRRPARLAMAVVWRKCLLCFSSCFGPYGNSNRFESIHEQKRKRYGSGGFRRCHVSIK